MPAATVPSPVYVVAFARFPVPGKVKTRLAASCGNEAACEIYEACLTHCLRESVKTGYKVLCACSEEEEVPRMEEWLHGKSLDVKVITQDPSEDLGERLFAAVSYVLQHLGSRVIVVGTDVPDITAEAIAHANGELNVHDISLGPSEDGGYYLIAMSSPHADLFRNIHWSTSNVHTATLAAASAAGLSFPQQTSLPRLRDIDYVEDLAAWVQEHQGTIKERHLMWESAVAVVTRV